MWPGNGSASEIPSFRAAGSLSCNGDELMSPQPASGAGKIRERYSLLQMDHLNNDGIYACIHAERICIEQLRRHRGKHFCLFAWQCCSASGFCAEALDVAHVPVVLDVVLAIVDIVVVALVADIAGINKGKATPVLLDVIVPWLPLLLL